MGPHARLEILELLSPAPADPWEHFLIQPLEEAENTELTDVCQLWATSPPSSAQPGAASPENSIDLVLA